jgi:benzylsuccinate CoA-transferase BbsF subunit
MTPNEECGSLPLSGVRVVDFGHVWAGPYCTATLADLGADVVKIESPRRLDIHRRQGPYAGRRAGINRSGVWNAQNRNKRSVALDLTSEADCEKARELVKRSDIVVENFSPGVMAKLGFAYVDLHRIKSDIIMASLSACGQDGPQHHFVGYGPSLDAWAGLCSLNAYPDGVPMAAGGVFPDTASALYAVFALLDALEERDRTGNGRYIDMSELEVTALLIADVFVAFPGQDVPADWIGNNDAYHVPQGAYPCAGDDRWIMICVDSDAAWSGMCQLLSRPQWTLAPAFRNATARAECRSTIDEAIRDWTSRRTPAEAFRELQARDVPAGMAHDIPGLLSDEQIVARGTFRKVDHPEAGSQVLYAPIWRFDGMAGPLRPAPLLGENDGELIETLGAQRPET